MTETITYGRRITDLAAAHPGRLAVVHVTEDGGERLVTWAELERRANQAARLLLARGADSRRRSTDLSADEPGPPEPLVAIALRNTAEHVFFTLGAWKIGATVLPLRWDLPPWERDRILGLAEPSVVLAEAEAGDGPAPVVTVGELTAAAGLDASPLPGDPVPDPARAIATSGSTGSPKLIVSLAPGVMSEEAATTGMLGGLPSEIIQVVTSPLYHTNGFGCYFRLLAGARLILMERFTAASFVDLVERWRANHAVMVPTMLQRVARLPGVEGRDLSTIAAIYYGGAPLPAWAARIWLDLVGAHHFYFQYGGTEGIGGTQARGDEWLTHEGTVGRAIGCELRIQDEEGRAVPSGEVGEIFMRRLDGPPPFRYIGAPMPEVTPDGFTTFGDLGRLDEEGYLYVADRRVDMIVSGGANIYPAEVEMALSGHPGVRDVVVVGLEDPEWGRRVHAVVEPVDLRHPPSAGDLRAFCRGRIAGYKVPKSFEIVERLPRTDAGKLNRTVLAAERQPQRDQPDGP
jgi:bile acid-coenzyme A ligase